MYESVNKLASAALGTVIIISLAACNVGDSTTELAENPNITTAKKWVTAGAAGKAEAIAAVQELMGDDGLLYRGRYVGFGFTWDPTDEEGRMIVGTIIPESPVDGLLQPGDQFLSVRGVEVNEANMGSLDFRGRPGDVVDAVILRDGETVSISVARGIIDTPIGKAQMLEWMETGDAETWGPEKWELHEAIGSGNVVYVWTQSFDTDDVSGLQVDVHTVTRFELNEAGKVVALGNLSEDRFSLEQAGWTISR